MKLLTLLTCIIAGAMLLAMKPSFSFVGLMKLTGTKQGDIKGRPSTTGADGMDITSFKMGSQAPLDPKSPGGQKQHHLVVVTKEVDIASPKFQTAVNNSEIFKTVEIQLGKTNGTGKKSLTNVKLANATISQIRKTEANMEEIAFSFQTISVQYTDGSTSTTDDWNANNQ
jgi:type VI secretion system Hcp family effector